MTNIDPWVIKFINPEESIQMQKASSPNTSLVDTLELYRGVCVALAYLRRGL